MLSRTEITSRISFPLIETNPMSNRTDNTIGNVDDSNPNKKASNGLNKKNIIKRALLRNSDVDLYLPTQLFSEPKKITSSFEKDIVNKHKRGNNIETNRTLTNKQMIYHTEANEDNKANKERRAKIFQECQSKDYLEIKAKFNEVHKRLKSFKDEVPKPKEGNPHFNLKELIKKVKLITKSVKLNIRSRQDITNNYRLHAIANKKDSKSVEEYLRLEKSIENIYLQKVILNIEYDNVFNERKRIKHNSIKQGNRNNNNNYDKSPVFSSFKNNNQSGGPKPSQLTLEANMHSIHSMLNAKSKHDPNKNKKVLITEMNKKDPDISCFDQKYFLDKYKKALLTIGDEEKSHKDKMIFTSKEINEIMKSKKDIVLDGLKMEYVNKYNENIDLNKKIEQKGKELFSQIEFRNKEDQQKRIGKKVSQAFYYAEDGSMESMKYQIKNYLKGCDFDFNYDIKPKLNE